MGTTEQIARFIVGTDFDSIPAEAVRPAKDAVLDGLGVTLAGSTEPGSEIIAQYVKEWGHSPGRRDRQRLQGPRSVGCPGQRHHGSCSGL